MMMKKYASLLFALVLALSLSVSAAADTRSSDGSENTLLPSASSTAAACTS